MSIENPTLVHFRHFSSLLTNLPSTTVEMSLQIRLFMQNKAKFRKSQMNVNKVLTKDYENKTLGERGKKQSQTKPNKANLLKAKMNVNFYSTKDYENISNWTLFENKPNSKPIQTQTKPISNYPCVFELAVYNLVFRDGNLMHSMPNGRNFDGEYMKWQMRQEQTQ